MNDEEKFEALLVSEVVAVQQAGEDTFSGLLRTLAGVEPPALLGVLQSLAAEHPWAKGMIEQAVGTAGCCEMEAANEPAGQAFREATPHPLDFDWRFTGDTVTDLENIYLSLVPSSGTVLFLGTPSLFQAALQRPAHPSLTCVLIDKNVPSALDLSSRKDLKTVELNVCRDTLPNDLRADVILTDPPWYEQELQAFLWAAAALCRDGGAVIICLPGLMTRPGVAAERAEILGWAREKLGMECLTIYPKRARYQTPPFECNAWQAAGIRGVCSDWRAGDVAIFRKGTSRDLTDVRPQGPWESEWGSLRFDGLQLRLRPDPWTGFANPSLLRLFPDDVLPSVSRRDARRAQVDVWSSGNRVFACRGRAILERIGHALIGDGRIIATVENHLGRPLATPEKNLVDVAADQLLTLVECERRARQLHPPGK